MTKKRYSYITTPIYYASGQAHLGHAYTTLLSDCLAEYSRLCGNETRFITGMDEHGLKIERVAQKQGVTAQELVDSLAVSFQNTWQQLGVHTDDFIRTTEARHKQTAQAIWKKMADNGDIYLDSYEGDYCVDCEEYYQESELEDGNCCPIHKRPVERMSEESYFFKLSAYAERLIEHIESNPDFIVPKTRRNEVLSFLKGNEIRDLSISRTSFKWGVPVPGDDRHVMYVWVDALVNYISSLGGSDTDLFRSYWPEATHVIGKDILRFHAVYWPAILLSAGLSLPKKLVVHGWWTVQDKKISKSEPATKVDPTIFTEDITTDGIRFFLLKGLSLGNDGNLSFEELIHEVNVHLINNIANCLNRFCHMVQQNFEGQISKDLCEPLQNEDNTLLQRVEDAGTEMARQMDAYNPSAAITTLLTVASDVNTYIEAMAPWSLAKDPEQRQRCATVFLVIGSVLRWIAINGYPYFPVLSAKMKEQLQLSAPYVWQDRCEIDTVNVILGDVFLERIKPAQATALIEKWKQNK